MEIEIKSFFSRYKNTDFSLSLSKPFSFFRFVHKFQFLAYLVFFGVACISIVHILSIFLSTQLFPLQVDVNTLLNEATNPAIIEVWVFSSLFTLFCGIGLFRHQRRDDVFIFMLDKAFWYDILAVIVHLWFLYLAYTSTTFYYWTYLPYFLVVGGYVLIPECIDFINNFKNIKKRRYMVAALFGLVWVAAATVLLKVFNVSKDAIETVFLIVVGSMVFLVVLFFIWMVIELDLVPVIWKILKERMMEPLQYCIDWNWYRNLPDIQMINRIDLARNLEVHSTLRWRNRYVDSLIQKKVQLTGDWPSDTRPKYDDDELDYKLMKLDCADISDLRKPF